MLTPGRAQQIALARLILADPHTIVLDEATSLIDPRTARHLEGSMNALLTGRTVVAIAHRLHTAHDADRIAVVIDGRVVELGSHDELVAQRRRVRRPLARLDLLMPGARRGGPLTPSTGWWLARVRVGAMSTRQATGTGRTAYVIVGGGLAAARAVEGIRESTTRRVRSSS